MYTYIRADHTYRSYICTYIEYTYHILTCICMYKYTYIHTRTTRLASRTRLLRRDPFMHIYIHAYIHAHIHATASAWLGEEDRFRRIWILRRPQHKNHTLGPANPGTSHWRGLNSWVRQHAAVLKSTLCALMRICAFGWRWWEDMNFASSLVNRFCLGHKRCAGHRFGCGNPRNTHYAKDSSANLNRYRSLTI